MLISIHHRIVPSINAPVSAKAPLNKPHHPSPHPSTQMPISGTSTAIVAAICAATGALLGSLIAALYNHFIEKHKRNREERDAVSKYRDALLRSAEQLQSQLGHLCGGDVPIKVRQPSLSGRSAQYSYAYCILIYRISQLFCWTYLLQNDVQTIHYTPTPNDRHIMDILYAVQRGFEDPFTIHGNIVPFRVFRGFQESMGELMCVGVREKGTLHCMGYPEFWKAWTMLGDNEFRPWFSQLEDGLKALHESTELAVDCFRAMQFQHLLVDLVNALDPRSKRIYAHSRVRFEPRMTPELDCICTQCMNVNPAVFSLVQIIFGAGASSRSEANPTQTRTLRHFLLGILPSLSSSVGNMNPSPAMRVGSRRTDKIPHTHTEKGYDKQGKERVYGKVMR